MSLRLQGANALVAFQCGAHSIGVTNYEACPARCYGACVEQQRTAFVHICTHAGWLVLHSSAVTGGEVQPAGLLLR